MGLSSIFETGRDMLFPLSDLFYLQRQTIEPLRNSSNKSASGVPAGDAKGLGFAIRAARERSP